MVRFDRNGADAATIVREYRAGRCAIGRFQEFLKGRQEWLQKYNHDTLKANYRKAITRYEKWLKGGKLKC